MRLGQQQMVGGAEHEKIKIFQIQNSTCFSCLLALLDLLAQAGRLWCRGWSQCPLACMHWKRRLNRKKMSTIGRWYFEVTMIVPWLRARYKMNQAICFHLSFSSLIIILE